VLFRRMIRAGLPVWMMIQTSCASRPATNSTVEIGETIVSQDLASSQKILGANSDDEDQEIAEQQDAQADAEASEDQVLEDREFCKDNIYAQYLKNKYLAEHSKAQNPEKAFKPTRRSRRRVATRSPYDQREVEALYFARSRLVGETVPYFGAIPVVTNPRVEHWVRFFKNNGRNAFLRWLVRGESVRDVVVPILKAEGMPPEFIFLSMVESGFSNSAYSRARATGPWQFMPGTAKLYGLKMNAWMDERRDPAKSTQAAARLLRDLYEEFGDWYLAMAAYNAGPGRLRSAIRKAGTKDFWGLANSPYLPVETKNYVPKVLAALMLSSNPVGHGFEVIGDPLDVLPSTLVQVKKPVALRELALKLNIPERLLRHWNPELVNGLTPPMKAGAPYYLRVSNEVEKKWTEVSEQIAYLNIKDVMMHRVRRGDTIGSISTRYRVDQQQLLNFNPGLKPGRLKVGSEVAVPLSLATPSSRTSKFEKSLPVGSEG
jgi:membrane-bound lytic murein transglycosylase D